MHRRPWWRVLGLGGLMAALCWTAGAALAADLSGRKTLTLHGRDGRAVVIGQVNFEPRPDGAVGFALDLDRAAMPDHFLSMREFKCAPGDSEILCHVPYPYPQPATVTGADYVWLEHALIFLYKQPRDFGAKLRNGVYFRLQATDKGLTGLPQAIDLTVMGVPPDDPAVPPYRKALLRDDIPEGSRWVTRLTID